MMEETGLQRPPALVHRCSPVQDDLGTMPGTASCTDAHNDVNGLSWNMCTMGSQIQMPLKKYLPGLPEITSGLWSMTCVGE